jgi:hypothetical protein
MIWRKVVIQKCQQLRKSFGKIIRRHSITTFASQGSSLERTPARSASNPEINAIGIHSVQHAKDLGNFERAVVRQQHSSGTNADRSRLGSYTRDKNLRSGTGKCLHRMVLGNPVPLVS